MGLRPQVPDSLAHRRIFYRGSRTTSAQRRFRLLRQPCLGCTRRQPPQQVPGLRGGDPLQHFQRSLIAEVVGAHTLCGQLFQDDRHPSADFQRGADRHGFSQSWHCGCPQGRQVLGSLFAHGEVLIVQAIDETADSPDRIVLRNWPHPAPGARRPPWVLSATTTRLGKRSAQRSTPGPSRPVPPSKLPLHAEETNPIPGPSSRSLRNKAYGRPRTRGGFPWTSGNRTGRRRNSRSHGVARRRMDPSR